jgi:hypothetical protein
MIEIRDVYGKLCPVITLTTYWKDPFQLASYTLDYSYEFSDLHYSDIEKTGGSDFPIHTFPFYSTQDWEFSYRPVRHSIDVRHWVS